MDFSTLPILKQASDSADKIGSSDPDTTDQTLDLESSKNHELNKPVPGTWRFPTNRDLCCIYRVPTCLLKVNPEAYTPQLVLIGPLNHSLKSKALKSRRDITNAKSMDYVNLEEHKKIYLAKFAQRVEGNKIINGFRRTIEEEEDMIRASYSESTAWIKSPEFVEMILHDSVFIIELILRTSVVRPEKIGDPLMDEQCLESTIKDDLTLLENQLPYFIFEKLFDLIVPMYQMYNADKLHNGGVKFKAVKDELSVEVNFENGDLKIPLFSADDNAEITFRNIMAFEQCPWIISNGVGQNGALAEMVNKLCLGVQDNGSYYSEIATEVIDKDKCNKSRSGPART